jgi:hypothetical protein
MTKFWMEVESLAASTAATVVPALLNAYLNKAAGVPGAAPITIENVGRIAGIVAAASVLQHMAASQPVTQPAATAAGV